jgi:hypothetical protein
MRTSFRDIKTFFIFMFLYCDDDEFRIDNSPGIDNTTNSFSFLRPFILIPFKNKLKQKTNQRNK